MKEVQFIPAAWMELAAQNYPERVILYSRTVQIPDFLDAPLSSNKLPSGGHIHAEEAGIADGRSADTHMYLFCPSSLQQADYPRGGSAPYNTVIDNDHSLSG